MNDSADSASDAGSARTGEPPFIPSGFGVAHPWLCDVMGHLTTRHYLGFFDDASYQLLASLGYDSASATREGWGWADVRHEIEYLAEVGLGSLVRIEGRVTSIGRSSLQLEFRMIERAGDRHCATLIAKTVCFDLRARKSQEVPEAIRRQIATLFGVR
jgi:Predicted thioesterase